MIDMTRGDDWHFGAEDKGVIILEFLDPDFGCDGQIVPA
jgi:hypothetical protein